MRILISNSDSLGDFVLREPLFTALSNAGHELALIIRSQVAYIAKWVAPQAQVIHLSGDPYLPDFASDADAVQAAIAGARSFAPDILGIVQYQRTMFEELLASSLEGARVFGLDGYLYPGNIDCGLNLESRIHLDVPVGVSVDSHELRKNELLCSALLQRNVSLPPPTLPRDAGDSESGRARLTQLGLDAGGYWVACIGDNPYTRIRNWTAEAWVAVLSHCVRTYGRRFLLVGTPDENQRAEEIRWSMGEAGWAVSNLCNTRDSPDTLLSLIAMSNGYLGRDTGPMHIAAALGKPVVALFGGGTWPRFTPAAQTGIAFTIPLACAGCNWLCHLPDSYCVKRVPVAEVIAGLDELEAGTISGFQIRALDPDNVLTAQIIRESSLLAIEKRRSAGRVQQEQTTLAAECADVTVERERAREETQAVQARAGELERERDELMTLTSVLRNDCDAVQQSRAELQSELETVQQSRSDLQSELEAEQKSRMELQTEVEGLQKSRLELQSELEAEQKSRKTIWGIFQRRG